MLEFVARSRSNTGWVGKGTGLVRVESPTPETLLFHESGRWHADIQRVPGKDIEFKNIYRWSLSEAKIRLEHLRFGEKHAVYLFDLAPDTETVWSSITPHLCRADQYTARLELHDSGISLNWQIVGPEKDEDILYQYH